MNIKKTLAIVLVLIAVLAGSVAPVQEGAMEGGSYENPSSKLMK